MTFLDMIRQYIGRKRVDNFIKKNAWGDLVPYNIVEYNGKVPKNIEGYNETTKLRYLGLEKVLGPAGYKVAEPAFGPAHPKEGNFKIFLREAKPEDFRKIGHLDPYQWGGLIMKAEKQVTEEIEKNYSEADIEKLFGELSSEEVNKMNNLVMDRANTHWWCNEKREKYKDERFDYSNPDFKRIAIEVYKEVYLNH